MNLCFSTVGCPEWSFGEILAAARDLSYKSIEVRGVASEIYAPRIPQFTPEHVAATRAQMAGLGLSIPILSSDSALHVRAWHERARAEVGEYIALAKALGTPLVRVMADDPRPQPSGPVDEDAAAELLRPLCDQAAASGVTLALETHGWFCDTKRLAALIRRVDRPNLGVVWDIHHPYRFAGETPEQTMNNIGSLVRHVHVKDSQMTNGAPRYTMCGLGDVPIADFVRLLAASGYTGAYALEWVRRWDLTLEAPGIVFAQYVAYMNAL